MGAFKIRWPGEGRKNNEGEGDLARTMLGLMDNLCDLDSVAAAAGGAGVTSR